MNEVEILLVEDNPQDADRAIRALKKHPLAFKVVWVEDGAAALDFIFRADSKTGGTLCHRPDAIVLNLKLPKVDGLEVLRRLKSHPKAKTIPVVLLTASRGEQDVVRGYELGVNSCLFKPVNSDTFPEAVASQLGLYWPAEPSAKAASPRLPETRTQELRILILEDAANDAELMERELRREGIQFAAKRVWTETDFLAELGNTPDVILADYSLPSYDGFSALKSAVAGCPETPFIFVSGRLGEEIAIDALHHGAWDYVLKQRLERLGPAVGRVLREVEGNRERKRTEEELKKAQAELFEASRRAGMVEVASSVLHNVGNVLNSVNVSATLLSCQLKESKTGYVARIAALMREHAADLGEFITRDPQGKRLPDFLNQLADHLISEQTTMLLEMEQVPEKRRAHQGNRGDAAELRPAVRRFRNGAYHRPGGRRPADGFRLAGAPQTANCSRIRPADPGDHRGET